jgi:dolichol-phosphate mannosyltransferase
MWVASRLILGMEVVHLHETAIFYYCILALLFGAQFLLAGLLSELIVSRTQDANPPYSIAQRISHESNNSE